MLGLFGCWAQCGCCRCRASPAHMMLLMQARFPPSPAPPGARRQGALGTTRAKAQTPHTFEDVLCQFRASTGISLARTQHVGNPRMRRD